MENTLEQINKSATKFLAPLTTEETFKIIVGEAKKIIGGEYGTIFLEEKGELKRVYSDVDFLRKFKQRKYGFTYTTFTTIQPQVVDVDAEKSFHPEIKKNGIKSIVHIPLAYKDKAIGVLTVHSLSPKKLSKHDLHAFSLYGSLASMAIRKTQLYDETKNALETRDLFISLASHELRTPLTSINGYISLLQNRMKQSDSIEAKWVKELSDESKRLTNLVKELLEMNKIKQGQLQYDLTECDILQTIELTVKRYSFINPDRKMIVEKPKIDEMIVIIGDCEKIMQMLTALLNNADKFSPKEKNIEVIVSATSSHVKIQVKDYGVGVARDDLKKVFEGFYKGDTKESQGLGVGLLLARHIIQFHHGTITMKSTKGKSTTIEIKLPRLKS
ncbi:hypothetical protein BH09PAT1_BH09PAT1_3250 [soil metagenome]